jgi:hypothetical protein
VEVEMSDVVVNGTKKDGNRNNVAKWGDVNVEFEMEKL